jgi:hypothetical protein
VTGVTAIQIAVDYLAWAEGSTRKGKARNEKVFCCCCLCINKEMFNVRGGTRWRSWLRHCSTSRKVAGSFPMVSLEFIMALWPWVPGIFPGGKGGRWVGLTTLPPSCAGCLEIWEPQPPGTLRACPPFTTMLKGKSPSDLSTAVRWKKI